MFVTTPGLKEEVPYPLREPEADYWAAVKLSTEGPWYLLTLKLPGEEGHFAQTVAIAWETNLVAAIEQVGSDSVLAVNRLATDGSRAGRWGITAIHEIWLPARSEKMVGPVLFRLSGERHLRDSFLKVTRMAPAGCSLLVRVPDESSAC